MTKYTGIKIKQILPPQPNIALTSSISKINYPVYLCMFEYI